MQKKVSWKYLIFIFLLYTFLFNEPLSSVIPAFGYEDELLAVAAVPIWIAVAAKKKKIPKNPGEAPFVLGFLLCSLLGSIVFNYQPFLKVALPDMLLCTKFWLCIYTGRAVINNLNIRRYAGNLYFHIRIVTWFYFLLSIINLATGIFPFFDYRYGLGSNSLFYSHPTVLAGCCSLLMVMLFAIRPYIKGWAFYFALLSVTMFTTLRTKAIADTLVFILVYYLIKKKKQKFTLKSLLPLVPAVALIGWSQVEFYFIRLGEKSARAQLLIKSIQIARDHFPLGAGFGTYGSHYSAIYYSPLYYKYGLSAIYGLSEKMYSFICDSFWPMILGQAGFFGMVFYCLALVKLLQRLKRIRDKNLDLFISAMAAMSYLLIDSAASTAFAHPLSMPFALWLGILTAEAGRTDMREETLMENPG